ncbi:MAG: hypothetical protein JJ992_21320, partial [Planctomycetes bacterium]|nr:hypothetical protein [Planctomycetota bacterium]
MQIDRRIDELAFLGGQASHERTHDPSVIADDRIGTLPAADPILADMHIMLIHQPPQVMVDMIEVDRQPTQAVQRQVESFPHVTHGLVDRVQAGDQRRVEKP